MTELHIFTKKMKKMYQKFGTFKKKQYLCIVKTKKKDNKQNDNKTESESSERSNLVEYSDGNRCRRNI